MKEDINLVPQKKEERKMLNNYFYASLGFFSVMFLLGALLIAYSLIIRAGLGGLTNEEANVRSQLTALSGRIGKIALVNERTDSIKNIISNRDKLTILTSNLLAAIPNTFTISSLVGTDKAIQLAISSNSLADFDNFFEQIVPKLAKNKLSSISSVEISSFSQDGDGYSLSVSFLLSQPK